MASAWEKMSVEELEIEYDCFHYIERIPPEDALPAYFNFLETESEKARQRLDCELDVSYGDTEDKKLDIFGAKTLPSDAPVFVYIHGGYWRVGSRRHHSYIAENFNKAGAVTVSVGYDLAPDATMSEIVESGRQAVLYIIKWARKRGSRGVYISGHSAGAHLTSMVMATDLVAKYNLQPEDVNIIKGTILLAGVYDLRPFVHLSHNETLRLTSQTAWEFSPMKYTEDIAVRSAHMKVLVIVGKLESPEFIRQSREMHEALLKNGMMSSFMALDSVDHFNMVMDLILKDNHLLKDILAFMELTPEDINGEKNAI